MENKKTILIVDDDIDVLAVIKTILDNEGHEIIMATGKDEAIEKAKSKNPDLVICDVMMSTQHEGFELAEILKNDNELKVPVLMQTSIDIFASKSGDVMRYAREIREKSGSKEMDVLLVENTTTSSAGIEYITETGKIKWLSVDGFIRKPVKAKTLIEAVNRVL